MKPTAKARSNHVVIPVAGRWLDIHLRRLLNYESRVADAVGPQIRMTKQSEHANVVRLTTALLLFGLAAHAPAETPVVPCAGPRIEFPAVGAEPTIRVFKETDLAGWKPPACTGWPTEKFEFIGTTAASFRHTGDAIELARRYGAISEYAAMRYFSPRRQAWRELSFEAFALRDANAANKRGDFTAAEFIPGPHVISGNAAQPRHRRPFRAASNWSTVSIYWNARRIA